ncbi:MAG TPA: hypothetical protein VME92_17870 [Acetobacteraceae bacterium]|nr:hypothetical protein [Acetobacteraceae bacterium]
MRLGVIVALLALGLLRATPCAAAGTAGPGFTDPAAYCAAVGTLDRPDSNYTGPAMPDWIARALRRVTGAPPDAPLRFFRQGAWRCDHGRVLACGVGANIPCFQKAEQSRVPTAAERAFCEQRPDSSVIPAYVASHATIWLWRCRGTEPVIVRQVLHVDDQGYPSEFWHVVTPAEGAPLRG